MIVTDLDFDMDMVRGSMPIGGGTRSSGLHLTDVIHSLAVTVGMSEDTASAEQLRAYGSVGFMWERVMEHGMAMSCVSERYARVGEVVLDGIAGSPDLLDLCDNIIIDTKVTFKSSGQLADLQRNFWHWIVQLRGYCYMMTKVSGMEWNVAEAWVLPICGNWKPPMIQPPVRKRLEFTQVELVDNWHMIVQHAREKGWL